MKCGIDLVDICRIEALVAKFGEAKLARLWTLREIAECTTSKGVIRSESLAVRFACKEAIAKALGTGFGRCGVEALDIEILSGENKEPMATLHGNTKNYFDECGYSEIAISLTHSDTAAAAICILN